MHRYLLLTLKIKQWFYQQKWVCWGIADTWTMTNIKTHELWQNNRQVWRQACCFIGGRANWEERLKTMSPLEETRNSKCSGFSMARLWQCLISWAIAEEGENLTSSYRGRRVENVLLLEMQHLFLLVWGNQWWVVQCESSPTGPLDSNFGWGLFYEFSQYPHLCLCCTLA